MLNLILLIPHTSTEVHLPHLPNVVGDFMTTYTLSKKEKFNIIQMREHSTQSGLDPSKNRHRERL